jgi:peptidoglycan/LPS O-acetylase OafA/YrhL
MLSTKVTGALLFCAVLGFSCDIWAANTIASAAVMIILLKNSSVTRLFSGRVGEILGQLSFPLYLVHALVLLSASSFVYVEISQLFSNSSIVLLLTLAVTVLVSIGMAIPFVILESHWVPWLNRQVKQLLHRIFAPKILASAGIQ